MVDVPWPRPLRVLAFGDSNTWGFVADPSGGAPARLPDDRRWPGVMQAALGSDVTVLVDAICGRRTDVDAEPGTEQNPPSLRVVAPSSFNGWAHAEVAGLACAAATATSGADRIHLDAADHHRLGQAVASRVRTLLEFAP